MSTYKQPVNIPTPDISLSTDPNTLKAGDMGMGKGTARVSMGIELSERGPRVRKFTARYRRDRYSVASSRVFVGCSG